VILAELFVYRLHTQNVSITRFIGTQQNWLTLLGCKNQLESIFDRRELQDYCHYWIICSRLYMSLVRAHNAINWGLIEALLFLRLFISCCSFDSSTRHKISHTPPLKILRAKTAQNLAFSILSHIVRPQFCLPTNFPQANDFLLIYYDVLHTKWHRFQQISSRNFCWPRSSSGHCIESQASAR